MVPEGWKKGVIEDIANVSSGGTPSRKKDSYWSGNIPWVTTAEVKYGVIKDTEQKITEEGLKNSSAKLFPKDTILMAMYGQGKTRGQVAKLGIEASTNQACAALLLKSGYSVDYYYQYLVGQYENIRELANSGGQQNLSSGIIKSIPVPIPPIPEQQKIARILSTWDKAITNTEKRIDNSKQQKKALMQQLLTGKKRFPGFEGEWEEVALSDIAKVSIGLVTTMTKYYVDNGIPLIRNSDIKQNTIKKSGMLQLCSDFSSEFESRKLRKGDVITVHTGDVGVSAIIDDELDGCIGFATLNTRPNTEKVNASFLSWYFNSQPLINWCVAMSTGDGRQNLNLKDFVKARVLLPCISEQNKIVSILTNADKEIELLEQQLADLKQEKKALMQQLLTGKRRVKVNEAEVA